MKKLIFIIGVIFVGNGVTNNFMAQSPPKETVSSVYELADKLYGEIQNDYEIEYLLNKTLIDTLANIYQYNKMIDSLVDANWFYAALKELKFMALDTTSVPAIQNLYREVSKYIGKIEFEELIEIYPIGILDYNYIWIQEEKPIWEKMNETEREKWIEDDEDYIINNRRLKLVAPLFNYFSSEKMAIVFKEEYFFSNTHNIEDIDSIKVRWIDTVFLINFDEEFKFTPVLDSIQEFIFTIYFNDGDSIYNKCKIDTPDLGDFQTKSFKEGADIHFHRFEQKGYLKLRADIVPGCGNDPIFPGFPGVPHTTIYIPKKPYILVTGYRPWLFGQSPEKTWKNYSTHHDHLLDQLRKSGYDIILISFNMSEHPNSLGIQEAAELLVQYIEYLNDLKKQYGYEEYENVVQGSSMGASVARLALLKMEKEHFNNTNYPHHHCRLFVSYDANYHGANLPLAYQLQILSAFRYPIPTNIFFGNIIPYQLSNLVQNGNVFLQVFLNETIRQKATKELLQYHALGIGNTDFVSSITKHKEWTPNHTQHRQDYLDEVEDAYDNLPYYPHGKLFMPVPISTRNISISLGKIDGTNDYNSQGLDFNAAGGNWRHVDAGLYIHILRAGKFQSSKLLFRRKIGIDVDLGFWEFSLNIVDHKLTVKDMQEIDNASGSYLKGFGNLVAVANIAYGFNWFNIFSKPKFSHKSVLSALAIHKNQWPANGSHTRNMQSLNLMYIDKINNQLIQSNNKGYPNLGRPSDHFQVTPFEAVYVSDNHILPHIDYKKEEDAIIAPLNDFIKNEVEPCYLGLQNQNLGKQARSNYTYKAKLRANNVIAVGNSVTPKTDPGDYTTEANAELTLEAGEIIHLKPGTHFKSGSKVHLKIHYDPCPGFPRPCAMQGMAPYNDGSSDSADNVDKIPVETFDGNTENKEVISDLMLFPNPNTGNFSVVSSSSTISSLQIYNLNGLKIDEVRGINSSQYEYSNNLKQGVYIVYIYTHGKVYPKKIIVL